jgi:predicted nucleic acid-binding Zn ribbon protein
MLEFSDCPHCGKRIRTDASFCHRCGGEVRESAQPRATSKGSSQLKGFPDDESQQGFTDQAAVYGGYDSEQDDFDYEEFLEEEFDKPKKKRKFWYYVAWMVMASLTLPIVLQVLKLLGV